MKILYVKNNSERSDEYKLRTIIYEENGQKFVKKEASCLKARKHLNNMKESYTVLSDLIVNPKVKLAKILADNSDSIVFEFIEGKNYERHLYDAFHDDIHNFYDCIQQFIDLVYTSFDTTPLLMTGLSKENSAILSEHWKGSLKKELGFKGVTNIDAIFSNIIVANDIYYLIDYEWVMKESLPVDYLIYRALKYSAFFKEGLAYEGILKIVENIECYEALERRFQSKVYGPESFFSVKHNYLKYEVSKNKGYATLLKGFFNKLLEKIAGI